MRGSGYGRVIAENVNAVTPLTTMKKQLGRAKRMCWKCQQDKHTTGGHIKAIKDGPMKFICKDCMDAKAKKEAE